MLYILKYMYEDWGIKKENNALRRGVLCLHFVKYLCLSGHLGALYSSSNIFY